MAFWFDSPAPAAPAGLEVWRDSLRRACRWVIDRSQIKTREPGFVGSEFAHLDRFADWRGAFRGEYYAATRRWDIFGPTWHGGQGVRALVLAAAVLGEPECLVAARAGADFLLRCQITDPADPDCGMLRSYEDASGGVSTAATLETLDGLFVLAEATGEARYAEAALAALRWVQQKVYLPAEGLFLDNYDADRREAHSSEAMSRSPFGFPGRPLLDDGVFLTGWKLTGDESLKAVAVRVAERLLAEEEPPGNWRRFPPADAKSGVIHPRHAFWWGRPLLLVHAATGEARFLDCARRAAEWYVRALRADGGLFRDTYPDFRTPSFGQATSGAACAAILWHDLVQQHGDAEWRAPLRKALDFCRSVQFVNASDPNLEGAILEKVLPPRGRDAPPWYLRDIGVFFYIQALALVLRDLPEVLE